MGRILHPLFALLASVTRQDLARQVAYLKEENKILRARLPERLVATPQEKRRLLRFGRKLGQQLKELISIINYQSFLSWVREAEAAHTAKKATPKRKPGRPRTADHIREVQLRVNPAAYLASDTTCSMADRTLVAQDFGSWSWNAALRMLTPGMTEYSINSEIEECCIQFSTHEMSVDQ